MKVHIVPAWVARIKHLKELWIAKCTPPDIPPTVLVGRDGLVEAMVIAPQVDRDKGLIVARALYSGFEPDVLFLAFEVCRKQVPSPETPIAKGQLQRELEAGSTEVSEGIMLLEAKSCGEIGAWELSYRGKGRSFKWLDFQERRDSFTGFLVDQVRAIMTDADGHAKELRETAHKMASEMGIVLENEAWHRSRGTLRFLEGLDFLCFDYRDVPDGCERYPLKTEAPDDGHRGRDR